MFTVKRQAIIYAEGRAWFRSGEIRILDSTGNLERTIPFNDTNRKLWGCDSRLRWATLIETHEQEGELKEP